jgi:UPF0176 protein
VSKPYLIATFYRFVALPNVQDIRDPLLDLAHRYQIRGTILLASEGYNATLAGLPEDLDGFRADVAAFHPAFADLSWGESWHDTVPFGTMKVRLKAETIRMKQDAVDVTLAHGTHVSPQDWQDLLQRDDVVVLDTRNDYEVAFGTFRGAVNPRLDHFHHFPAWAKENLPDKTKTVAMFCTGGIRCEKAAALMKAEGFDHVYQLQGGILNYFAKTQDQQDLWQGSCFVFDDRVAVTPDLEAIPAPLCACLGSTLTTEAIKFPEEPFASCGVCIPTIR